DQEPERSAPRRELRPGHPGRATAPWLRPACLVAAHRRDHGGCGTRRLRRLGVDARARARACGRPARPGTRAPGRRRAATLRGLMEKAGARFVPGFASIAVPCALRAVPRYPSAVSPR